MSVIVLTAYKKASLTNSGNIADNRVAPICVTFGLTEKLIKIYTEALYTYQPEAIMKEITSGVGHKENYLQINIT